MISKNSWQAKMTEKIIVIPEKKLFRGIPFSENFFFHSKTKIIKNILMLGEEYDKDLAENNIDYKQIVAYMIFSYKNKFFIMQRNKTTNILSLKYSLGIGGHLRKQDIKNNIGQWGGRELKEEVEIENGFRTKLIGFINDNSNDIGKKHFGLVYLIKGRSSHISIRSEMISGEMVTIENIQPYFSRLESWSSLLAKKLLKIKTK